MSSQSLTVSFLLGEVYTLLILDRYPSLTEAESGGSDQPSPSFCLGLLRMGALVHSEFFGGRYFLVTP